MILGRLLRRLGCREHAAADRLRLSCEESEFRQNWADQAIGAYARIRRIMAEARADSRRLERLLAELEADAEDNDRLRAMTVLVRQSPICVPGTTEPAVRRRGGRLSADETDKP